MHSCTLHISPGLRQIPRQPHQPQKPHEPRQWQGYVHTMTTYTYQQVTLESPTICYSSMPPGHVRVLYSKGNDGFWYDRILVQIIVTFLSGPSCPIGYYAVITAKGNWTYGNRPLCEVVWTVQLWERWQMDVRTDQMYYHFSIYLQILAELTLITHLFKDIILECRRQEWEVCS